MAARAEASARSAPLIAVAVVALLGLAGSSVASTVSGEVTLRAGAAWPAGVELGLFRVDDPAHTATIVPLAAPRFSVSVAPGIYQVAARGAGMKACMQSIDARHDVSALTLLLHPEHGRRPELAAELVAMAHEDQRVRQPGAAVDAMKAVDVRNEARMRVLLQQGWPHAEEVGCAAVDAAWLLVQHSLALLPDVLPQLEQAARDGELRRSALALSIDRVREQQGHRQLYGSQVHAGPDGRWAPDPIEDEPAVDERRPAMGMDPLAAYLASFNDDTVRPRASSASPAASSGG
jgi:hypothetical protein